MGIRIERLTDEREEVYEAFLHSLETSLLYHSVRYRNFLRSILDDSEDCYLLAYEGKDLVGALPAFVKKNETYGSVINSLPFYGSNGSVLISPVCEHPDDVKKELLEAFDRLAKEYGALTSTLITNPLEPGAISESEIAHTWRDERIGQITPLPAYDGNNDHLSEALMSRFHKKTRNSIRKAAKSGFAVSHSGSLEAMKRLGLLHRKNLERIGGLYKPESVFMAIRETFR